jgi:hypothetical protein
MTSTRRRAPSVGLAAFLLATSFAALFAAISRGVFLYGDDVLMFEVTEAIVERGEVAVTSTAPRKSTTHSIPGVDGRRYVKYGIAPSLVAIPFYAASGPLFDRFELTETRDEFGSRRTGAAVFGIGLANAFVGGAGVALSFLLGVELGASVAASFFAALLLGCGTLWMHYSATFMSEPLAGLSLAVAVLCVATFERKAHPGEGPHARWWLAISGFAAGMLVATKIVMVLAIWPVGLWVLAISWRAGRLRTLLANGLAWGLPLLAWAGGMAFYNWTRFGSVLATGYGDESRMFTTPLFAGLGGLLLSPAKGVVWYCPVVVLSLFGLSFALRKSQTRRQALVVLAVSGSFVLIFAKYYQWYGGGVWGPRFLVPLLPLWLPFSAFVFDGFGKRPGIVKMGVAILAAASMVVSLASILVPFDEDPRFVIGSPREMREAAWDVGRSPLVRALERLPDAGALSLRKLTAAGPWASGRALAAEGGPDFAFVRYGSHALLQWTRAALVLFVLLLGAAALAAARAQKALLSRPPQ